MNKLSDNQQFNVVKANYEAFKRWGFALEDRETDAPQTEERFRLIIKQEKASENKKYEKNCAL